MEGRVNMDEELRKIIADYFDAGDFAEFIGVSTMQLINAFEDEVMDNMEDIKEMIGLRYIEDVEIEE